MCPATTPPTVNSLQRTDAQTHSGEQITEPGKRAPPEPMGARGARSPPPHATPPRRQGLGAAVTVAALDLARRRGVRTVYLLTETAGQFFPKFGFTQITRAQVEPVVLHSPEFTTACPKSALVMVKQL